tara:strand:+ start:3697 stop:4143 length:447 start_codon:yes stop_codon:yes gene_type:complete
MPVDGATVADWHPQSFWYEPWGSSGVHKGIDIFAGTDTPVIATTHLVVLFSGNLHKGGKVVLGVGPKWRLHYFAHLNHIDTNLGLVKAGQPIGRVGDSGNAAGKPPHLHYSIVSLLPRPWLVDFSTQGYKKAFFLDPGRYITADLTSD